MAHLEGPTSLSQQQPAASAHEWAQLVDLAITRREVHIEQLQLFVSGALRHPALVNKDGACRRARLADEPTRPR